MLPHIAFVNQRYAHIAERTPRGESVPEEEPFRRAGNKKNRQRGVWPLSRHPDAAAISYSVNMNSLDTCPHFLCAPMVCARRSPLGRTRPVRFDGLRHTRLLPKSCPRSNINPFDYALSSSPPPLLTMSRGYVPFTRIHSAADNLSSPPFLSNVFVRLYPTPAFVFLSSRCLAYSLTSPSTKSPPDESSSSSTMMSAQ